MSKTVILVIAAALVIGAGVYFFTKRGDRGFMGDRMPQGEVTSEETTGMSSMRTSMRALMMRSGSWKCEFTQTTEGSQSTGVVYISEGMMRGNFVSQVPQMGEVKSYMITRDGFVHTWSDAMPQGFKMPVSSAESTQGGTQSEANMYGQEMDYNCMSWEADPSMFALPTTVTFMQIGVPQQ